MGLTQVIVYQGGVFALPVAFVLSIPTLTRDCTSPREPQADQSGLQMQDMDRRAMDLPPNFKIA